MPDEMTLHCASKGAGDLKTHQTLLDNLTTHFYSGLIKISSPPPLNSPPSFVIKHQSFEWMTTLFAKGRHCTVYALML